MKALPENLSAYKKTPEFDESSVPEGLLKAHRTRAGTWGKIVILEGSLRYTINEPEREVVMLDKDYFGIVEPEISHEVSPLGKVRFHIEFYR